jgi:nucleotide-binding universal stress UspA family protein
LRSIVIGKAVAIDLREVAEDGLERFLLGSVSSKLAQHAPASHMVVRDDQLR